MPKPSARVPTEVEAAQLASCDACVDVEAAEAPRTEPTHGDCDAAAAFAGPPEGAFDRGGLAELPEFSGEPSDDADARLRPMPAGASPAVNFPSPIQDWSDSPTNNDCCLPPSPRGKAGELSPLSPPPSESGLPCPRALDMSPTTSPPRGLSPPRCCSISVLLMLPPPPVVKCGPLLLLLPLVPLPNPIPA